MGSVGNFLRGGRGVIFRWVALGNSTGCLEGFSRGSEEKL
jgi:hypothetical protein